MKVLVLGHPEVTQLLPMDACIDVMASAFAALAEGSAIQPLRLAVRLPVQRAALGLMPAYLGDRGAIGAKVVTVFPENRQTRFESHQGAVHLFEAEHGRLLALLDASSITAIRTAAASGVATRLLARPEAGELAILGSGTQAAMHLAAMRAVRPIRRVRVWSRNPANAARFAARQAELHGLPVEGCTTAREAVAGAEIICTTTAAQEPILCGEWVAPGAHVNAVGASVPPFRELDADLVVRSRLYTDRRESLLNEADDFRIPQREGLIGEEHLRGEIGEVIIGRVAGRTGADEVTLFKSLGLALEDVAAAHYIYQQALAQGLGTWVEFNGEREEG